MSKPRVELTAEQSAQAYAAVEAGRFGSVEAYVQHLLALDAQRVTLERRMAELVQEAIDSGPAIEMTPQRWDEWKRSVDAAIQSAAYASSHKGAA